MLSTPMNLAQRVVHASDYIPCEEAFVDTRLPGREGKLNYCIIGPGVAENGKQVVHIAEPHGFNVGGVSLPTGKINSLHSHTTAEVFLICRGDWRFFWGYDGRDGEAVLSPGDVISIPTGTFRAFESVGVDDNFMMSWLGEDDPGQLTWENDVIEGAAAYGFYLRKDSSLVDTGAGEALPPPNELLQTLSEAELLRFNRTSPGEMAARIYHVDRFKGISNAFADCALAGGEKTYHPIIGEGIHEFGEHRAHILNPHSFSLAAVVAQPEQGFLAHRFNVKQVLVVGEGEWELRMGPDASTADTFRLGAEDTASVPAGLWRSFRNVGKDRGVIYVASAGDLHADIEWSSEVIGQLA